ncbi:MAG: DUF1579 domain-containing protein [Myxococcota bacterium]|nr:DUF1579 domain-containing protein [Myxococcota bacterium]
MHSSAGSEVDVLAADAGVWRAAVEVRPSPDAAAQKSEGKMTGRMCGPWLLTDFTNETSGFEGHGIYGWDSVGQKYVATWVDPMRRALVVMEGRWDQSARTMTFVGEMSRPDGSRISWREVTERPEDDLRVFRSFVPSPHGGVFEAMTVRYERTR